MQENTNKNFGRKVKPQAFSTFSGGIWSRTLLELPKSPYRWSNLPDQHLYAVLNTYSIQKVKGKSGTWPRGRQPILLRVINPRYQISPTCQQMDPENQAFNWKHFMTIFKCKYFPLSLHLAQICTNNLEVTSYYILLSNPSDSALFLVAVTVHWCFHSPLKMPV